MAAHRHMVFGRDIVYTYGPLGFLGRAQTYFGWTYALAVLFTALVWFGTAALVYRLARRNVSALPAWVFTWCVLACKAIQDLESADLAGVAVALLLLSLILDHDTSKPTGPRWIVLASAGAALGVLVKLNTGAMLVAIVLIW